MENANHDMQSLFAQLGLNNSQAAIDLFISQHSPLASDIELHQADFWSATQKAFLEEAIEDDADWSMVVDSLNVLLRND